MTLSLRKMELNVLRDEAINNGKSDEVAQIDEELEELNKMIQASIQSDAIKF